MFPDETRNRQEKLSNEVLELSKAPLDNEKIKSKGGVISRLQLIYGDNFKHSYSDLFPVILKIFQNNTYNKDYLTENLELIRSILELDYSEAKNMYQDIYNPFTKLCDHLNLQISQLSVIFETESKVNDATSAMEGANDELKKALKVLEDANTKAKSLQTELIAVLSIFAAIVISFSGGFTFLGSVMTSIKEATYFESVVLAALVCGTVIFNTIFLMMYFVGKIMEKNIYARCLTKDCSCGSDGKKCKCNGIRRIRKRLPYVFYFNVASIIGIVISLIIWYLDIKNIII